MEGVDDNTITKLESAFEKLQNSDSQSLLRKHLTRDLFDKLKVKKTSYGSTLLDCIQSGTPCDHFQDHLSLLSSSFFKLWFFFLKLPTLFSHPRIFLFVFSVFVLASQCLYLRSVRSFCSCWNCRKITAPCPVFFEILLGYVRDAATFCDCK